jgi:hypothetical protein
MFAYQTKIQGVLLILRCHRDSSLRSELWKKHEGEQCNSAW